MFLKFRKKHKSSIDLQNSNFLLIIFTDLNFLQKKFFNFLKQHTSSLDLHFNFFSGCTRCPSSARRIWRRRLCPGATPTFSTRTNKILIAWKDNKGVYMASNKFDADTTNNCRRFWRTEKKDVTVPIPTIVQRYNTGMGGVDLMDNMVACYRIPFRIIKWWIPGVWVWV